MPERILIRGDSYETRRPLYRTQFLDELGLPMNLTGCVIRTTYKSQIADPASDPLDESAPIRHMLVVSEAGIPTSQDGLYLIGNAENGVVEERLTSTETRTLPLNTLLYSDIELTDSLGEVFTWIMNEPIRAIDAYTNRRQV